VPRIWELGLTLPDPMLGLDPATGDWRYTEPDWDELRTVVTNHGPKSEERLQFRRDNREATRWVRDAILAAPQVAA
jgi:ring-1,2-phenylacetyl-CoA epoxidase subunit PaaA